MKLDIYLDHELIGSIERVNSGSDGVKTTTIWDVKMEITRNPKNNKNLINCFVFDDNALPYWDSRSVEECACRSSSKSKPDRFKLIFQALSTNPVKKKRQIILLNYKRMLKRERMKPRQIDKFLKIFNPNHIMPNGSPFVNEVILHECEDEVSTFFSELLLRSPILQMRDTRTGNTPLHVAILNKKEAIVERLMANYEHLQYLEDFEGNTPLHVAAKSEIVAFSMILKICSRSAPYFTNNRDGMIPFHLAIASKPLMKSKMIARASRTNSPEIDIYNYPTAHGVYPLKLAMQTGDIEYIGWLLHNGADPFIIDSSGDSAFSLASDKDQVQTCMYLAHNSRSFMGLMKKPLRDSLSRQDSDECNDLKTFIIRREVEKSFDIHFEKDNMGFRLIKPIPIVNNIEEETQDEKLEENDRLVWLNGQKIVGETSEESLIALLNTTKCLCLVVSRALKLGDDDYDDSEVFF